MKNAHSDWLIKAAHVYMYIYASKENLCFDDINIFKYSIFGPYMYTVGYIPRPKDTVYSNVVNVPNKLICDWKPQARRLAIFRLKLVEI